MIYVVDEPQDTDPANQIHTYIQDTKQQVRERMEAPNGTFNEHNDVSSSDAGLHIPSKVSFVRVSTEANRLDISATRQGSMHYITDGDDIGLAIVDDTPEYKKVSASSHSDLIGLSEGNPHSQYVYTGGTYTASDDMTIDSVSTAEDYPTNKIVNNSSPIDSLHNSLDWYNAHGEKSLAYRHFTELVDLNEGEPIRFYADGSFVEQSSGSSTSFSFGGPGDSVQETPTNDIVPFLLLGRIGNADILPYTVSRDNDGEVTVELSSQTDLDVDSLAEDGSLYGDSAFYAFRFKVE